MLSIQIIYLQKMVAKNAQFVIKEYTLIANINASVEWLFLMESCIKYPHEYTQLINDSSIFNLIKTRSKIE